jgi:hypothetical protein
MSRMRKLTTAAPVSLFLTGKRNCPPLDIEVHPSLLVLAKAMPLDAVLTERRAALLLVDFPV